MKNTNHIAVGLYHSVAITKDNKVFVWGRGSEG
jgi:X-linked retinitis pigmentosa GTPase regulator